MWAFFSKRLRQWVILAVLLPLLSVAVQVVRQRLEKRSGGPTRLTEALSKVESLGRRNR